MRTRLAISAAAAASLTLGLAAAAALPGPAARADQVFHTAHFPLHPVGSEPLRSGFVDKEKIGCSIDPMSSLGIASATSQMKKSWIG